FRISPTQALIPPPESSSSQIPDAPPVSNPELAKICNNILMRMKDLHQLRIQHGDVNELINFQKNTREWVREVNKEVEAAQLKRKGRLSIPNNFFNETTVTNQVWRENLGLLDSDLNMHLKFSMDPGPLFVKKEFVENP
ncbi:hypothetical protein A2U01_0050742, partial [Trifolium medium]|nr:hypothetical protein [Trifolium medium]